MPTAYLVFHAQVNPVTAQHFMARVPTLFRAMTNYIYAFQRQEVRLHLE